MERVRGSRFAVRGSIAAWFVAAAPAVALACPVCGFAGNADNATAYTVMTVIMSGVPLAMIGGVVFWIVRRANRH